jgi:peroxisomal 3,2-trans-enoyl-CoA isomerase
MISFPIPFQTFINIPQFNRPKSLNAFGGNMVPETINAIRDLNNDPNTIFTVLTGEGRFFCAGADVRGNPSLSISLKQV